VLFAGIDERYVGPLRLYVPDFASIDLVALALTGMALVLVFVLRAGIATTLAVCGAVSLSWLRLAA
jgi:chromate transporter